MGGLGDLVETLRPRRTGSVANVHVERLGARSQARRFRRVVRDRHVRTDKRPEAPSLALLEEV
jgi:hypothetical protein